MTENKKKFSPMFWLVIMFEFFERGSYYGMMSVLSVYFTDVLMFEKGSVGVIKSIIQPLLYFLPIITGALADRFGYRRMLMIAFSLLGTGYFLTAQMSTYGMVFMALVVMGVGAGTFKPIISGSIARMTDENNSAVGFGIFYWSINLGAFLFPLLLVPFLKNNIGWKWVFYASALGTGAMLIPTLLFFKEPPLPDNIQKKETNLLQTLANSFEIIYSPIVLIYKQYNEKKLVIPVIYFVITFLLLGMGIKSYFQGNSVTLTVSDYPVQVEDSVWYVGINRNMMVPEEFTVDTKTKTVTVNKPDVEGAFERLTEACNQIPADQLKNAFEKAYSLTSLTFTKSDQPGFKLKETADRHFEVKIGDNVDVANLYAELQENEFLKPFSKEKVKDYVKKAYERPFSFLFVGLLLFSAFLILFIRQNKVGEQSFIIGTGLLIAVFCFLLPEISMIARVVSFFIFLTVLALYTIDVSSKAIYKDHFKFLLLIFIYSGFWVLYFQMFDSVLWYVQAYVNATPLNESVNWLLSKVGISMNWYFDVEHVTVMNAFTIIALQLFVTAFVKNKDAMKTMIGGISLGVIGMAILSVSTGIWVFLGGIIIFSIGEMSVHPKFISYVGQTAPKDKVAMYMGYLFLYGVIGASIGGVLGANMYVHYVDRLNKPDTLWLLFSLIGVVTIVALLIYNKVFSNNQDTEKVN